MLTVMTAFSPTLIGETTETLTSTGTLLTTKSLLVELPLYISLPVNVATTVKVSLLTGVYSQVANPALTTWTV